MFTERNGKGTMCDLMAGFLRFADYRIATRNTEATTAKASFGPGRFVSLLPGSRGVPGEVNGLRKAREP